MCKALNYTQKIINVLEEANGEKERLYNLVHKCDLKTCDLLHEIELNDIKGMYNAWQLVKEIKEVRQIRRKAKDELLMLDAINNYNLAQIKKLSNITRSLQLKESKMQKRQYRIRVNESLDITSLLNATSTEALHV